jgi:hypothetical protein
MVAPNFHKLLHITCKADICINAVCQNNILGQYILKLKQTLTDATTKPSSAACVHNIKNSTLLLSKLHTVTLMSELFQQKTTNNLIKQPNNKES